MERYVIFVSTVFVICTENVKKPSYKIATLTSCFLIFVDHNFIFDTVPVHMSNLTGDVTDYYLCTYMLNNKHIQGAYAKSATVFS